MPDRERTIGPYRLGAKLGEGGMGEVWQATDTRLKRDVAVKLLPAAVAGDALRLARFEREAQVLASLNHPGIAAIYGVEERALVMELVPGETLAERIGGRALPLDDALALAGQIAEALAYAHDRGVVHRDLKPANIKITPDGQVKILDFGLAKAMSTESGSQSSLLDAPTLTTPATLAGTVLGTAAYMAPEQARGQNVDRRADIWAFGVVLYEMLTGERPFGGPTVSDTLAAVLKETPDWQPVPAPARRLVQLCLEKDPRKRLRDVQDGLLLVGTAADVPIAGPASRVGMRLPWAIAALVAVVAAVVVALRSPHSEPLPAVRSAITPPPGASFNFAARFGGPVLSPDGGNLVFPATGPNGQTQLWLRPLDSSTAHPLPGTQGASFPFWSPDSRSIGFFVPNELERIDLSGQPPQVVCGAPSGRGGSWNAEGVIVFAPRPKGGLERVAASGGAPVPIMLPTGSRGRFASQRWPYFLPDGRHFIFWAGSLLGQQTARNGIYLASLDAKAPVFLLPADSDALYAAPGYLLFLRQRSLMAQPFDAGRLRLDGAARALKGNVANGENYRLGDFSVSQNGVLVYTGLADLATQVVRVDSNGRELARVGSPGNTAALRLSPDGKTLAEVIPDPVSGLPELWLMDLGRDVRTQFTFQGANLSPVWSPHGRRIAFYSTRGGNFSPYIKPADGSGGATPLPTTAFTEVPTDWSPDGRALAVMQEDTAGKWGVRILPLAGNQKPWRFSDSPADIPDLRFSPDGKWLASVSDQSGAEEIYISPYPAGGGKWQVSRGSGTEPEWSRDGRTIYYEAPGGRMMAVALSGSAQAPTLGAPRQLFTLPMAPLTGGNNYQVLPGGQFLVLESPNGGEKPVTVVSNWTAELPR